MAGDGERLAGEADLRLVTASGNLSATARAIPKGYASPRTARGQAGARELTLRASRRFGAFTLSAAAAHREDESLSRQELEETEEPCDPLLPPPELGFCPEELRLFARTRSDAWLRAEWTAAPWLRLRGLHQTTDYLLETVRWDQRHSAVGLERGRLETDASTAASASSGAR